MTTLPKHARALLDTATCATVATIEPDGQPHLSVVWVGRDGDEVLFSTVRGRRKTDNLLRDPRATVLMFPADDPYRYLEIRGTVTVVDDPEQAYIHQMARKYTDQDRFENADPAQQRVIVRLAPAKVVWHG
jgi:PPOX class probable F420-dependent enzyme